MSSKKVDNEEEEIKIVEFPTVYGGEYGPDINFVAEHNNITVDEVIKIHTGTDYLVYMMGFTPGFTYLGGMSNKIATPRLSSPRTKIPAGSVGIAGAQTGMYPSETPGGWQLIGRTPLKLYDPDKEPPVMLSAGDYVRYVSVSEEEYLEIKKQVEEGTYEVKVIISEGGDLRE
jgi:KipI family sensor histidine kinase inhibitor